MTNQIAQPFGNVQDQESYHLEQLRAISARVLAAKEDEFGEDFSTFVGHLKALRVSQCRDELAQLVSEVPYHELNALVPVME
ncbi:MAG TPA: hypothetical protein PLK94_03180, partial [Alphaproteobacteria bacterium]|nr:hypothetical protein [Alphaproteobacteria bacterium]